MPDALAQLLFRCLACDPADRPRSAQELLEALDSPELLTGSVTVSRQRRATRWSLGFGAAAAVVLVSALFGGHARANASSGAHSLRAAVAAAAETRSKIAIVPFVDLGSDSGGAHGGAQGGAQIATGITNAVAASLSKSGSLRVIAPSVSGGLGRKLRDGGDSRAGPAADLLLEGTVQRERGRLRVTARLSNASDGVMRWADVYDGNGNDLFDLTDDIAGAIVASVANRKG